METRRLHWLSLLTLILLALTACGGPATTPALVARPTETPRATLAPTVYPPPTRAPTFEPFTPAPAYKPRTIEYGNIQLVLYDEFETTMLVNPQDDSKVDVCVQDVKTGKVELCTTIPGVSQWRHAENLYAIWMVGYTPETWDSDEWTLELWRYGTDGKGTRLYSAQGLDFRVAPDERYIALRVSDRKNTWEKLIFLDSSGNPVQEFTAEQLTAHDKKGHAPLPASLSLLEWSDNDEEFWGVISAGPSPQTVYEIDTNTWRATLYDISGLAIPKEYDLNVNTAKLVYSDCPQIYVADDAEEFARSQQQVTLFVYDLNSQNAQVIATAVAKCFHPRWLGDDTIEYSDPNGDDRITYTVLAEQAHWQRNH